MLPTRAFLPASESRLMAPHLQHVTPLRYVALSTPRLVCSSWSPKAVAQLEHHLERVWCLRGRKAGGSPSFLSLDADLNEVYCEGPRPVFGKPSPSLVAQLVKNPPAMREASFDPWVGTIPRRRERLSTPVFWPGEFHGLCSPWGCKELDTTE